MGGQPPHQREYSRTDILTISCQSEIITDTESINIIQFAKLTILISLDLSGCTILLVTAPQIDGCHVLCTFICLKIEAKLGCLQANILSVGI